MTQASGSEISFVFGSVSGEVPHVIELVDADPLDHRGDEFVPVGVLPHLHLDAEQAADHALDRVVAGAALVEAGTDVG